MGPENENGGLLDDRDEMSISQLKRSCSKM